MNKEMPSQETPEEIKKAERMLEGDKIVSSMMREDTLTEDKVALAHNRHVLFEGGKIFLAEGGEPGKGYQSKIEQSPVEAFKGLEREESGILSKIKILQHNLEKVQTLKERVLRIQADQIKK